MTQKHFISFGAARYRNSVKRICLEAEKIAVFNKVTGYGEQELFSFPEFQQHKNFVYSNPRGFGYWIWKPFLIMKYMETMNEGDSLLYADAGCVINEKGRKRMLEYFEIVKTHPSGIIGFEIPHLEKTWTKMDLVKFLDAEQYIHTNQLLGGIIFFRNCENTRNLVRQWYEIGINYNLSDDSPSKSPNDSSFIEHRHDQSIFSLLRKRSGCFIIPDETWFTGPSSEWSQEYPIWATRKVS
jgi:hypothetical protein